MPWPRHPEVAEEWSRSCMHRSTAIPPLRSGRIDDGPSSMRASPYSAASISEHEPRRGEKVIAKGEALGGAVADSSARGLKGRHAAASPRGPSGRGGFVNGAALQGAALRYDLAGLSGLDRSSARHPELAEGSSCCSTHRSTAIPPLRSGRIDGGPSSMRTSPSWAASISEHEPRRGEKVIAKGEALVEGTHIHRPEA